MYIKSDAFSMFTENDNGCKHSLQLKNSLKYYFDKWITRNLQRKNAYGGLQWPDVVCNNNVTLMLDDVINVVMT